MIKTSQARSLPYGVVHAFFPLSYSVFIAVIFPQKFQRPFLFISLFESFGYHEYQSVIIFAVVKKCQLQNFLFSFKSSLIIQKILWTQKKVALVYHTVDLFANVIGELIFSWGRREIGCWGGGEVVTCLLVISPLMNEVEFSPTDLEGPVCIELPSYKSQKIVVIHEVGLYEDYPSLTIWIQRAR